MVTEAPPRVGDVVNARARVHVAAVRWVRDPSAVSRVRLDEELDRYVVALDADTKPWRTGRAV